MPRVTLTPKLINTLPLPVDRKSIDYFDQRMPGLVLRASAGGTRTWNVLYRHKGRARRLTLGRCDVISLDDARNRARQTLCDVTRGVDPARTEPEPTFGDLAQQFISQHVSKLKRSKQTARLIERELIAEWRNRRATSITRRDVALLLAPISERAPVLANRVHATLRRMYSWAGGQGIVSTNPCDGVERPTREKARERVLSDKEVAALWSALNQLDVTWRVLFQLCLLTSQRVGEVVSMRWSDIGRDVWTITDTKNGRSHRVPLTPQALQRLADVPRRGDHVFATGKRPTGHLRGYRKAFQRACTLAGVSDACAHDLRRTAASTMASLGVSRSTLGQILNHADRSVTAVYDRYSYDVEKRAALQIWATHVVKIVPI